MVALSRGSQCYWQRAKGAPPCLDLMLEQWAPNPGMQNTSLCDASTDHDDDADTDDMMASDDEATGLTRNKHKKTNGLRALADGVKLVGEAMKEMAFASAEPSISGRR
ncbi:hypothetical protein PF008_g13448 [Phytophthora fragariae]|uniref:Uncharacterized protein n=1 Tax=Phytophthora fragariae TaxID=53985 RepID=A0A6G0RKQ9_9STRA|nr:hypothetical protein PF008_g13448 [Phytophthora fragariae]